MKPFGKILLTMFPRYQEFEPVNKWLFTPLLLNNLKGWLITVSLYVSLCLMLLFEHKQYLQSCGAES